MTTTDKSLRTIRDWEERFDEIGFGNQARIAGAKRVELKDFIRRLLEEQRRYIQKAFKDEYEKYSPPNTISDDLERHKQYGRLRALHFIDALIQRMGGKGK